MKKAKLVCGLLLFLGIRPGTSESAGLETSSDNDLNGPFECFDGKEIDRKLVCDGNRDCVMSETNPGGEDEKDCEQAGQETSSDDDDQNLNGPFECFDGEEIDRKQVCDGIRDCAISQTYPGGEDEKDCELPSPRMVIVGGTGVGKSSLANSLLGLDPELDDALFEVCEHLDSCTKETKYGIGQWLGKGKKFTVVDTFGFADSDDQDLELLPRMINVLKNQIKSAHAIIFAIKGTETRFHKGLQEMLTQMSAIFGDRWWEYMILGVSFWKFDEASIKERERRCPGRFCKNEEWFRDQIQKQLKEKFKLKQNITMAFLHSYSQTAYNIEDEIQQQHWKEQTQILWDFATAKDKPFEFKDVDDIIQENTRNKREIERLNNVINKKITALETVVSTIPDEITALQTDLNQTMMNLVPLGTILSWVTKPSNAPDTEMLRPEPPDGWVKCDGRRIAKGIWKDKLTPDLNGGRRFLRGGREADMLTMEEDILKGHGHAISDPGHNHGISDTGHTHGITDPEHSHSYWDEQPCNHKKYGGGIHGVIDSQCDVRRTSYSSHTGIRINSRKTGISINKGYTGIQVTNVFPSSLSGEETRPKNMAVIYIMKVY